MPVVVLKIPQLVELMFEAGVVDLSVNHARELKHGWSPGAYINMRRFQSQPTKHRVAITAATMLAKRYHEDTSLSPSPGRFGFDVIASIAIGAITLGHPIAWELGIPHFTVRTKTKKYGTGGGFIDGNTETLRGARVLLVEDTTTTFASVQNAIRMLEDCGAEVVKILIFAAWGLPVFYRNAEPYDVVVLCDGHQLVDYAEKNIDALPEHKISSEHATALRKWINTGEIPR